MKSLFTLSQILKQHHWQPVPNDEMTSPYSWVIIRKIFLVWIFYIDGFTNLILAFYLSLKELSLLPLSVERLESLIPRSWQMSVVFLHFCSSGFKPCLGICFLCIANDNVVQLPGKPICSGAKSPSSPEGAFSEAEIRVFFFLLDKTVFLDLTNQSRHFYSDQMRVDTEGWLRRNLEVWSGPVLACRPPWQRWLAWQWCCPRWQRWERGQSQTSLHLSQRLQTVYIIDNWDWRRINCIEFLNWPGVALETSGGEGEMVPSCVGLSQILTVFVFVFVELWEKVISHHLVQVLTGQKYFSVKERVIKRSECPPTQRVEPFERSFHWHNSLNKSFISDSVLHFWEIDTCWKKQFYLKNVFPQCIIITSLRMAVFVLDIVHWTLCAPVFESSWEQILHRFLSMCAAHIVTKIKYTSHLVQNISLKTMM